MTGERRGSPVAGVIARIRSFVNGLLHRDDIERAMREEFRHHIELRTADLVRGGMSWEEAARRARVEFGHVETHRESGRAARGLHVLDRIGFSWIDVRLGVRMLLKHPGLTAVSLFALAVGIPVGMAPMYVARMVRAPLPADHEDRVRVVRFLDPAHARYTQPTYDDYARWRERSTLFERMGAFRGSLYSLSTGDAAPVSADGAELTASVFTILGTPPLVGRALEQGDEAPGAPDVVVIGADLWTSRFAADRSIVGRSIEIAGIPRTIVGVMPASFAFPDRQQLWVPLREELSAQGDGLALRVVGRLAEGVTSERAEAELRTIGRGRRVTSSDPEEVRGEVEVVPWVIGSTNLPDGGVESIPEFYIFRMVGYLLLLVACANVAMLVFARTVTRFREIAVRTALGASRSRIITQIFVETSVLAIVAAGIGTTTIAWALGQLLNVMARRFPLPYWLDVRITRETVLAALGLAVVSAAVAGVVPALRVTGRKINESIRRADASRSGTRFGGVTGALIVMDVAIVVIVSALVLSMADRLRDVARTRELTGIPAEEYLAAELRLPVHAMRTDDGIADREQFARHLAMTQRAVLDRLEQEPAVRGSTFADALPRMDAHSLRIEVEPATGSPTWVRVVRVDVGFFRALEQPIRAGRDFEAADASVDPAPIIVNTVFVDQFLAGRSPIGQRLRIVAADGTPGPWREIVGVVGHLGLNMVNPQGGPGLYMPVEAGVVHPVQFAIHVRSNPESFAPRLREIVAEVDPGATLGNPVVLDRVYQGDWYIMLAVAGGLIMLVALLIALAASGLYAMLAFSVSQRRREIGIRTALGARRGGMVALILRRSVSQLAIGALLGVPVAARLLHQLRSDSGRTMPASLSIVAALALGVCAVLVIGLLSGLAPVRRALRISPRDALNAES
jgi:putative ABC transport system permease protein